MLPKAAKFIKASGWTCLLWVGDIGLKLYLNLLLFSWGFNNCSTLKYAVANPFIVLLFLLSSELVAELLLESIEWKIPIHKSFCATAPYSPGSNFSVIIWFSISTDSTIPPPGDLHLSPIWTSTLLYRNSGTSNHSLNFSDFNSASAFWSIFPPLNPVWKSPNFIPLLNLIVPCAVSSTTLDK